jgi:hypothetical protein
MTNPYEDDLFRHDLFRHALNYRTAHTKQAKTMWQELQACVQRKLDEAQDKILELEAQLDDARHD